MAITLDKTITRNSDNTITTTTNYNELNLKASALVEDIVGKVETELTSAETQLNATVTTKVNEFDARINQIASIDDSTYNTDAIDTKATAMSKAEFEALANERKANRAGSGFDEFGKTYASVVTYPNVNEGIWTVPTDPNNFRIGIDSGTILGTSKTGMPYVNINGVTTRIKGVNLQDQNKIVLPTAPKVTHADSSNSGMVLNGRNMVDTSGWTTQLSPILTIVDGRIKIEATTSNSGIIQTLSTIAGVEYTIELTTRNPVGGMNFIFDGTMLDASLGDGRWEFKFTAIDTSSKIDIIGSLGESIELESIMICPSHEISRSDLVFLESWHEDTAEKGVLYDLGNVQYKGTRTVGDAGSFVGSDTYSLFGNWQQAGALVGNSISIASLTFAELQEFVGNPENNCYYDGDKLIQVRYRVRVVQGLGDEWYNLNTQNPSSSYMAFNYGNPFWVKPKGKLVSMDSDLGSTSVYGIYGNKNSAFATLSETGEGMFTAMWSDADEGVPRIAYEGKCYALPIALVHRRNSGAYHVKFNPNGTKAFLNKDGLTPAHWYNTDQNITSIADCFDV